MRYLYLGISNEESYTISTKTFVGESDSFDEALKNMQMAYYIKDLRLLEIDREKEKAVYHSESRRSVYDEKLEDMLDIVYFEVAYLINLDKNKDCTIEENLAYFNNKFGTIDTKNYIGL